MKRYSAMKLFFLLGIMSLIETSMAQSMYYYFDGKKMPLEINKEKVNILIPKEKDIATFNTAYPESMQKGIIENSLFHGAVLDLEKDNLKNDKDLKNQIAKQLSLVKKTDLLILPVYVTQQGKEIIETNLLKIKLKEKKDTLLLKQMAEKYHLMILGNNEWLPSWYILSVTEKTEGSSLNVANSLYETGLFASACPEFSFDARECISDPNFEQQWGLYNAQYPGIDINACQAWNISKGSGAVVAIIDCGIDMEHQDLKTNIYPISYDAASQTSPSTIHVAGDSRNHGTHCAGIVGAAINGIQVAGVAPESKLMSISTRMLLSYPIDFARGIAWAWANHADVISCSWWTPEDDAIKDAIDDALLYGRNGNGCVVVKSAGNNDGGAVTFPGNYRPEILTVSSIAKNGQLSDFSSIGPSVDVCAPGSAILSTGVENTVISMSGTSMACPHVAGIAALILSTNPYLTGQEVRDIIEQTAQKVGTLPYNNASDRQNGTWNSSYGYGLVDAYAAVQAAHCPNLIISNEIISSDRTISHCGDINLENVIIKAGAKLSIETPGEVIFGSDFEMEVGSELEMN